MSVNIGAPRVRGKIAFEDYEFGVDPVLIQWLQCPYYYQWTTGKYFIVENFDEKAQRKLKRTGQIELLEIHWNASPYAQGNA